MEMSERKGGLKEEGNKNVRKKRREGEKVKGSDIGDLAPFLLEYWYRWKESQDLELVLVAINVRYFSSKTSAPKLKNVDAQKRNLCI